jgi:hypothetical protein
MLKRAIRRATIRAVMAWRTDKSFEHEECRWWLLLKRVEDFQPGR